MDICPSSTFIAVYLLPKEVSLITASPAIFHFGIGIECCSLNILLEKGNPKNAAVIN